MLVDAVSDVAVGGQQADATSAFHLCKSRCDAVFELYNSFTNSHHTAIFPRIRTDPCAALLTNIRPDTNNLSDSAAAPAVNADETDHSPQSVGLESCNCVEYHTEH